MSVAKIVQLTNAESVGESLYPITTVDAINGLSDVGKSGGFSDLTTYPDSIMINISSPSYLSKITESTVDVMSSRNGWKAIVYSTNNNILFPEFFDGGSYYYCLDIIKVYQSVATIGKTYEICFYLGGLHYITNPKLFLCDYNTFQDKINNFLPTSSIYSATILTDPYVCKTDSNGNLVVPSSFSGNFTSPFPGRISGITVPIQVVEHNRYAVSTIRFTAVNDTYIVME